MGSVFVDSLKAITPLGGSTPRQDQVAGVTLVENCDVALASVAQRMGAAISGLDLPAVGKSVAGDPFSSFWTGPDQWMVEAPVSSHEDIVPALLPLLDGAVSVTEQSGGWARFDISGAGTISVLERLVMLDLGLMEHGDTARSMLDHIGVFLIRRGAQEFTLYAPRSSATSLHHALLQAMQSVL
jgi:methylglutamate dehydrogenase subunit D